MSRLTLSSSPKRFLIVRPDAIGDVVLITPLINSIQATWPSAQIYTLQQSYTSELFLHHPNVHQVLIDRRREAGYAGLLGQWRYAKWLRSFDFDVVFQPFLEPYFAQIMVMAGIPVRVGDGNKLGLRPYLTHPVPINFRDIHLHETESNIALLKGVAPAAVVDSSMDLHVDPEREAIVTKLLIEAGWAQGPYIVIHPTTGGGNRAWDPLLYAKTIDLIHQKLPHQIVLTGNGKKDEACHQAIIDNLQSPVISLLNKTNVDDLKWVIKKSDVVIGTDTGPTHMAAALGQKVLCISPTKFVKSLRWGPWQTPNRIVENASACPLTCFPYKCLERHCLDAILPSKVLTELENLLKETAVPTVPMLKQYWRRSSVNIGVICASDSQEAASQAIQAYMAALKAGYTCRLLVFSKKQAQYLAHHLGGQAVMTRLSPWNLKALVSKLNQDDLNDLVVLGAKRPWYWQWVVRQLAALRMYCPPVIRYRLPDQW